MLIIPQGGGNLGAELTWGRSSAQQPPRVLHPPACSPHPCVPGLRTTPAPPPRRRMPTSLSVFTSDGLQVSRKRKTFLPNGSNNNPMVAFRWPPGWLGARGPPDATPFAGPDHALPLQLGWGGGGGVVPGKIRASKPTWRWQMLFRPKQRSHY